MHDASTRLQLLHSIDVNQTNENWCSNIQWKKNQICKDQIAIARLDCSRYTTHTHTLYTIICRILLNVQFYSTKGQYFGRFIWFQLLFFYSHLNRWMFNILQSFRSNESLNIWRHKQSKTFNWLLIYNCVLFNIHLWELLSA